MKKVNNTQVTSVFLFFDWSDLKRNNQVCFIPFIQINVDYLRKPYIFLKLKLQELNICIF